MMQLMSYTAKVVAKQAKLTYSKARLTQDPDYNIKLGSHYLAGLILEYDGSYPFAIAAYNACLLYTSPSPRDGLLSRMPSSA